MDFLFVFKKIITERERKKWKKKNKVHLDLVPVSVKFQACAYFNQAICPIPIYTTGCKMRRSCLVSCCLSKRNLSWRKSQQLKRLSFGYVLLAPKTYSTWNYGTWLGCRADPSRSAWGETSLEAEDLEDKLCLSLTLQSQFSYFPQPSPLIYGNNSSHNTHLSRLQVQQNFIIM